ncbi:hypothetical protein [Allobaculum sp. Allo2]|nr:hypothetical protein [Allobaculum sp. Allo2]
MMKKYEVMYIVNASLDDEQFAALEKDCMLQSLRTAAPLTKWTTGA